MNVYLKQVDTNKHKNFQGHIEINVYHTEHDRILLNGERDWSGK
jgi:hypothetical protein